MNKYRIEIKWAIIFVIAALLWMLLERLVGLHDNYIHLHPYLTNLWMIPAVWVCVLALKDKKKNFYNGQISYWQALGSGVLITIIVVALNPLSQWVISQWISPHYFDNAIAYAVDNNKLSLAAAQDYFNYKSYVIQGSIGGMIMGTLSYAIIAIFIYTRGGAKNSKIQGVRKSKNRSLPK